MSKRRLDLEMVARGLVASRSQAESFIKLAEVIVDGHVVTKPGFLVGEEAVVRLTVKEQYVSRAALKLASVAEMLRLNFRDKTVLDVGSSTGGFTDYALHNDAANVIAVDIGTEQLHPSLRGNPKIELHEKTDVRGFKTDLSIDIVLADVSFVSLREILPHIATLASATTDIVTMVKPQFEAVKSNLKHKGVIKNERMRRDILREFEGWARQYFVILDKADSAVAGEKGNRERFYLLKKL